MTRDGAEKAIKQGACAAFISAGITFGVVFFATRGNAPGTLNLWNDYWNFFDVGLIFLLGFGILKKSRTAAVIMLLYFLVSKIIILLETNNITGMGMGLVFLYFFTRAVHGTFVYHRIQSFENTRYKPASKTFYWVTIPGVLLLVICLGALALMYGGIIPSVDVIKGDKIPSSQFHTLLEHKIITPEHDIDLFYSYGLSSILEGGSILTDRSLIAYQTDEHGELVIAELLFNEIDRVELMQKGDMLNDSWYKVYSTDPEYWMVVVLPEEKAADKTFMMALEQKMENAF